MGKINGNQLYKNNTFKKGFMKRMDDLLSEIDYKKYGSEYFYEGFGEKNNYGVLINILGIVYWSWMNTINTNYTCYELIINAVNYLIDKKIVKRSDFFTFEINRKTNQEIEEELDDLFMILSSYKEDFFTTKHKENKTSLFNKMRFATQYSWYKSCLSEIFFLENIENYFDNISSFTLSFDRGDEDDMYKGKDFFVIINNISKSFQHKKDKLKYFDGDYYCFQNMNYDKKNYETVDYIVITIGTHKNYIFENSINEELCGMVTLEDGNKHFRIHKSLLLEPLEGKKNTVMTLTENLLDLLDFANQKHIPFHMRREESLINTIEIIEEDELSVHVSYNNLEDKEFPNEVKKVLENLKQRFQ